MYLTKSPHRVIPATLHCWQILFSGHMFEVINIRIVLLLLANTIFINAVHAENGVSRSQILIGQNISLEGGKNTYGSAVLDGVKTYMDKINKAGGIYGRQIKFQIRDDDAKATKAEENTLKLIKEDKVFVVFGSIEGGPSTAVMKVTTEQGVPFIAPMAGPPTLRTPHNPLVFPVRAEHKNEFEVILQHAATSGFKRVAFMRASSEVGKMHLENVKKISQKLGLEVVVDLAFSGSPDDSQLGTMVKLIESQKISAVMNHGSISAYEKLIRKVRVNNASVVFYGVNSGSTQLAEKLGSLAVGMGFTQVVPNPRVGSSIISRLFLVDFRAAFPEKTPSYGALEGYMSAWILAEAIKRAGSNPTRDSLVAGLRNSELSAGGIPVVFKSGYHAGSNFVDLSVVSASGVIRH